MHFLLVVAARAADAAGPLSSGARPAVGVHSSIRGTGRFAAVAASPSIHAAATFSTALPHRYSSHAAVLIQSYVAAARGLPLSVARLTSSPRATRSCCMFSRTGDVFNPSTFVCVAAKRFFTHFRRVARLPLDATLRQNLRCMQINHLTHVQDVTFFPILSGRDVVAAARPGTGKTLAYLLPLLQRLLSTGALSMCGSPPRGVAAAVSESESQQRRRERGEYWVHRHVELNEQLPPTCDTASLGIPSVGGGPAAVILVPTRELCQQVACTALSLLPSLSVVVADSGTALQLQKQQLTRRAVDVVVGTPSRCLLLQQRGDLHLQRLRCMVLDEADMLLSKGYAYKVGLLLELSGFPGWAAAAQDSSSTDKENIRVAHCNTARKPCGSSRLTKTKPDGAKWSHKSDAGDSAAAAIDRRGAEGGRNAGEEVTNAVARSVQGEAMVKYVSAQEKRQQSGEQQQGYKRQNSLQWILFSSLMPQEVLRVIKARLQDAVVFSLLKHKKGRACGADKKESLESEAAVGRLPTLAAAEPAAASAAAAGDKNNVDKSFLGVDDIRSSCIAAAHAREAAFRCSSGVSVRHFACKVTCSPIARAASATEEAATLKSPAWSACIPPAAVAAASKLFAANPYGSTSSTPFAETSNEDRIVVLLHLIAKKLPHHVLKRRVETDRQKSGVASADADLLQREAAPEPLKCIVFADTQQEVEYIAEHPLLETWRIVTLHSGMTQENRNFHLQQFRTGKASVLVSTDIVARGIDVSSVALVVHFHPPADSSTYVHRAGRAGRGGVDGESVVIYTRAEWSKMRKIKEETRLKFVGIRAPTNAEHQEVITSCLLQSLLEVEERRFAPHLLRATRLMKSHGTEILASALALLYGVQYGSVRDYTGGVHQQQDVEQLCSVLTGRKNYSALLLYDPAHSRLKTPEEAAQYIKHLLPSSAPSSSVGRIMRSARGYVADVAVPYANPLISRTIHRHRRRSHSLLADVRIYPVEELPDLLLENKASRLRKAVRAKLSWAPMKNGSRKHAVHVRARRVFKPRTSAAPSTR